MNTQTLKEIDMMTNVAEAQAKERAEAKNAFAEWLDQPATRMMMSMIPSGEQREVLSTLLEETFNAGAGYGRARTAAQFLEAVFNGIERRETR